MDGTMSECGKCFGCERCITCEKVGPRTPMQPPRSPAPSQQMTCRLQSLVMDEQRLEQRVRQIVMDVLIELGLIPEARKRAKISPSK